MNARAIELLTIKSESSIKSGKRRDISGKKERAIDQYWQISRQNLAAKAQKSAMTHSAGRSSLKSMTSLTAFNN